MFALRGCRRVLLSPGTGPLGKIRTWPGGLGNIGQPLADVRLSFVADFVVAAPQDKTADHLVSPSAAAIIRDEALLGHLIRDESCPLAV
ncbi:hypothetical protein R3I94_004157 [Phoxinus phoxinus]|uniref:Uncharacterized protein n=1 Tax=Phoxinus phoxinus TaxID=58324 RepID=A0AAN9HBI5_9TELE